MRPVAAISALLLLAAGVALRSQNPEPPAPSPAAAPPLAENAAEPAALAAWSGSSREVPFHARGGTHRPARGTVAPETAAAGTEEPPPPERRATAVRTVAPRRAPRTSGSPAEFLADALFRRLDTNGDGVLTGSEIPTELRAGVGPRGSLDAETFTKLFRVTVRGLQAAAVSESHTVPSWFESLDSDGSGQVPFSRWRAAGRDVAEFHRMDADGDGILTRREVQVFTNQPVAASPAPSAAQPAAGGTPTAPGTAHASRSASDAQRAPNESHPRTKSDELFAHYTAVAAGVAPPLSGGIVLRPTTSKPAPSSPAPAKPQAAAPAPAKPAPATPTPAPAKPATPSPVLATLPMPLTGVDYWEIRDSENVAALLAGEKANVLFLGDSITDQLAHGAGKPLWADTYAPLGALDFAVNGLTTSQVLYQVESGQVALAAPKVVVLLIGTNNLGLGQKPQDVAAGVEKIVSEIGAQLPDARILLLGIFPRGAATDPLRPLIAETNRLIEDFDKSDRVTYLDIGKWFLSANGSISPTVMPDGLHPSLYGYELYTLAIWQTLTDLLPPPNRK